MKLRYTVSTVVLVTLTIVVQIPVRAEELSPVEYQDRFAYKHLLRALNIMHDRGLTGDAKKVASYFSSSAELAIMTLDRATSKEAYRGLAYLVLIELDGILARDHSCAVLEKGKAMLPYLEEARRASANGHCVIQEEIEVKMDPDLCLSREEANKEIQSFIDAVKNGEKC